MTMTSNLHIFSALAVHIRFDFDSSPGLTRCGIVTTVCRTLVGPRSVRWRCWGAVMRKDSKWNKRVLGQPEDELY